MSHCVSLCGKATEPLVGKVVPRATRTKSTHSRSTTGPRTHSHIGKPMGKHVVLSSPACRLSAPDSNQSHLRRGPASSSSLHSPTAISKPRVPIKVRDDSKRTTMDALEEALDGLEVRLLLPPPVKRCNASRDGSNSGVALFGNVFSGVALFGNDISPNETSSPRLSPAA